MFCIKCGSEIQEGAAFCPKCGQKIGESAGSAGGFSFGKLKEKAMNLASVAADSAKDISKDISNGKIGDAIDSMKKPSEEQLQTIASKYGNILYSTSANMQYVNKAVGNILGANKGGHLFLTESCLYFKAHALNVGEKEFVLPLGDIVGAGKSHQVNLMTGITPNMIQVDTINGATYKFVVGLKEREPLANLIVESAAKVEPNTPFLAERNTYVENNPNPVDPSEQLSEPTYVATPGANTTSAPQNSFDISPKEEGEIYHFDGGVGDILGVYEDHIVIRHKGVLNAFAMGIKGDKILYYTDITSIQYKKPGLAAGYIQFSLPGGKENTAGIFGATQDENTITLTGAATEGADKIVEFLNAKLKDVKTGRNAPVTAQATLSAADEIKKYKELLDMGALTQEEFDAKKKELLGL